MMSSLDRIVANLQFDRAFQEKVKAVEVARKQTLHTNGMPHHYYLVMKLICCMKDEDMSIENISVKYREVYGRGINSSALSRTLLYLSDNPKGTLGMIEYVDNPHVHDSRFKGIALTKSGRVLQKVLEGKTATTYSSKIKSNINV